MSLTYTQTVAQQLYDIVIWLLRQMIWSLLLLFRFIQIQFMFGALPSKIEIDDKKKVEQTEKENIELNIVPLTTAISAKKNETMNYDNYCFLAQYSIYVYFKLLLQS